ncbi:MAG: hypothetical protein JO097_12480 [Acidobacteriaceae bacterium]|nr:hypothetical protein [Acidobacteriaceae bacterium]
MTKKIWVLLLVSLFSLAAWAADVSGTWTGIFHTREGGAFETNLVLKADGNHLTGTFQQGNSDEISIENGKVNGDQISFSLTRGTGDKARQVNYTGKVEGNTMKLTLQMAGTTRTQEISLTRK